MAANTSLQLTQLMLLLRLTLVLWVSTKGPRRGGAPLPDWGSLNMQHLPWC